MVVNNVHSQIYFWPILTKSGFWRQILKPSPVSYAYWTVHHLDIWIKVDQLDVTCFSGSACTRIPHHQQTIPLHYTNTPQVSLHNNAPSSHKLLKMDVLTSETCWAVNWHNKASFIKLVYLYSNISSISQDFTQKKNLSSRNPSCYMRRDRQTHMTEVKGDVRDWANASKKKMN